MKYYVYTLSDPRTGSVFYVGKGTKRRCYHHLTESANTTCNMIKYNKIQSIYRSGLTPTIDIVSQHTSESESYAAEERLIDAIGLDNLTNIHPGGRGGSGNPSWKDPELNPSHKSKGLTYEERYGCDKAAWMRHIRSAKLKNRTFSNASKQLMSNSARKRDHSYKQRKVFTSDGIFDSMSEAADHFGISASAMSQRVRSANYPDFYLTK